MKNKLLKDLFSFARVARCNSFTKAALELNISPSALSKHIRRLEAELDVHLLKRTTREIRLTEVGKMCYEEVESLKKNVEDILGKLQSIKENPAGRLRIAAPFSFGQLYIAPVLWEFQELHPHIQAELVLGEFKTNFIEKNIDVGIFIYDVPDSQLIARRISERNIMICASPDYADKYGIPAIPEELENHHCLVYGVNRKYNHWQFKRAEEVFTVKVKGNFLANNTQVLAQAAMASKGIVRLPSYIVMKAVKEKKLISILEEYCFQRMGIFAAYPYARHLSPLIKIFVTFLMQKFQENKSNFL